MVKKSFITDCEGPLSLNDNAYEICAEFIPNGDLFFKIISNFDDYLVDIIKKPKYNSGNTLKLIAPFFRAYGVNNSDIIEFSKKNIFLVDEAKETIKLANKSMDSFIVSTSYAQYIQAICEYMNFPFENTYCTSLDMDIDINIDINVDGNSHSNKDMNTSDEILKYEKEKLFEFKDIIVELANENQSNINEDIFNKLNKIFFEEIPKLNIAKIAENINIVGGHGKKLAVDDIIAKNRLDKEGIIYVGDSHTDIEPLNFVKENNGISVSFNGNEFAINEAEIAIISESTIVTSFLVDLHSKFNKEYILGFVRSYSKDPKRAFESFRIGYVLIEKFNEIFQNKPLPIIEIVNKDNIEKLKIESINMRKKIRGKDIGSLG